MGHETEPEGCGRKGGREREGGCNFKSKGRGRMTLACWRSMLTDSLKWDHAGLEPELWLTFSLSRKALNKKVKLLDQYQTTSPRHTKNVLKGGKMESKESVQKGSCRGQGQSWWGLSGVAQGEE